MMIFSLLTGISLIIVLSASYFYTADQYNKMLQNDMKESITSQVNKLDGWLMGKAKMLEMVGSTVMKLPTAANIHEMPGSYLSGYQTIDKSLSDVYFGTLEGKLIDGSGWTAPPDYDARKRVWYSQTQAANKLIFTDPYIDLITKKWTISVTMPLKDGSGKFLGVLGEDILLETLTDNAKNINLNGQGYSMLLDAKGNILVHPEEDLLAKNILEVDKLKDILPVSKEMIAKDFGIMTFTRDGVEKIIVFQKIPSTGFTLGIIVPSEIIYKPLKDLRLLFIGVTIVVLLLIVAVTYVISRRLSTPLVDLAAKAQLIAEGDLTVKAHVEGKDEIADLASAFNKMSENLRSLVHKINQSGIEIFSAASGMKEAAQQTGQVSEQIAMAVSEIARGASDQSSAIEKEVGIVNQMSQSITDVSQDYENSAKLIMEVRDAVSMGDKAMTQQISLMEESKQAADSVGVTIAALAERSQKISQIIEVITAIAGQTNLLALNAAIEAARAGEQGRGFAVVADEVRKLAEQSGQSSQEIAKLVHEIQAMMQQAVKAMDNTAAVVNNQEKSVADAKEYFNKINQSVGHIVDQIKKVQSETNNTVRKAAEVQNVISDIASVASGNAATTEEVAAAVEEQSASVSSIAHETGRVMNLADNLKKDIQVFRI